MLDDIYFCCYNNNRKFVSCFRYCLCYFGERKRGKKKNYGKEKKYTLPSVSHFNFFSFLLLFYLFRFLLQTLSFFRTRLCKTIHTDGFISVYSFCLSCLHKTFNKEILTAMFSRHRTRTPLSTSRDLQEQTIRLVQLERSRSASTVARESSPKPAASVGTTMALSREGPAVRGGSATPTSPSQTLHIVSMPAEHPRRCAARLSLPSRAVAVVAPLVEPPSCCSVKEMALSEEHNAVSPSGSNGPSNTSVVSSPCLQRVSGAEHE